MNIRNLARPIGSLGCTLLLLLFPLAAGAEEFTNAIRAFLRQRVELEQRDAAIVVGLVDERGCRVVSCGSMDNGTGQQANGDTLFEVGSITKTFTGLLLQDLIERGEMKLEDPVAKYLPDSVKMPSYNGKCITLVQLATHTSGLPFFPTNLHPKRLDNPYADYTAADLYAFLSGYKLTQAPGKKWIYSDLGMELLGQAIALKAGTNYEALLVERICRPLGMDSTRVTVTPELKTRLATGHNQLGFAQPSLSFQGLVGASALRTTANDLLKYASANLGLTPSPLTPLMQRNHQPRKNLGGWSYTGVNWITTRDLGIEMVYHGGETLGHSAWIGLDKTRRRGVVVLASTSPDVWAAVRLGMLLLESDWESGHRPPESKARCVLPATCVGQYRLVPSYRLGIFGLQILLRNTPKWLLGLSAVIATAGVLLLRRRPARSRKGRIFRKSLLVIAVVSVPLAPVISSRLILASLKPSFGVRLEGDRVFAQLSRFTVELVPKSENCYFERISGWPINFSGAARGHPARVTVMAAGAAFTFEKYSDQAPEPPKPLAVFKLDPKLYDSYLGRYEFPPDELFADGLNVAIRRQGDQLKAEGSTKFGSLGAVDIYPVSETNFFLSIGLELSFNRNEKGEATNAVREGLGPDCAAKKLPDSR